MPIDASIPLGIKPPDQMQSLSGLLGVANGVQTLQQNQQRAQQGAIDLNERQGMQSILADPKNYTADDGTVDFNKALPAIMKVAPTTGMKYMQELAQVQKAHTDATQALNSLTSDNRAHIGSVLASLPENATPELVGKTIDALKKQYKGIEPAVSVFMSGYQGALKNGGSGAAYSFIQQQARGVLPQETQQTMNSGALAAVPTEQGTQFVQTKTGAAQPQGAQVGATLAPPKQIVTTPYGRTGVASPATGTYSDLSSPGGAAAPVNFPVGESQKTFDALQDERTAAKNIALQAPIMHDINRTIVQEASKPGAPDTGKWGALVRDIKSRVPGMNDTQGATDYDILGKMLERSALTAAQSMGPHTNAGLEAAVRANGSLGYTPDALKKIAHLNDALVSGAELYQQGLEKAIGSSSNNVFAKRQFDQEWGKVATPQALRLKNAVDTGNKEEVGNIVNEVGGKGTKGAQQLHQQLRKLLDLTGQ